LAGRAGFSGAKFEWHELKRDFECRSVLPAACFLSEAAGYRCYFCIRAKPNYGARSIVSAFSWRARLSRASPDAPIGPQLFGSLRLGRAQARTPRCFTLFPDAPIGPQLLDLRGWGARERARHGG